MSPRTIRTFRIDDEWFDALRAIEARDGVPVPEQVRRAIRAWVEGKGVQPKAKPVSRTKPRSS